MTQLGVTTKDLFGEIDDEVSPAEFFILSHLIENQSDITSRANWCFENLPMTGTRMLEMEDTILINDALKCYVLGLYASVIMTAVGLCERLLTDLVEHKFGRRKKKSSMTDYLKILEEKKVLDSYIISRLLRLHKIRNNLCHEQDSDNTFRISTREMNTKMHNSEILKEDAKEALCMMSGLNKRLIRNFPRTSIKF